MVTAQAIFSAQAGAAPTQFFWFLPDDLIVGDFCLAQFIPEVPVPSIANNWFVVKFFLDGWVDFQVLPLVVQDFLEAGYFFVVLHNEWNPA